MYLKDLKQWFALVSNMQAPGIIPLTFVLEPSKVTSRHFSPWCHTSLFPVTSCALTCSNPNGATSCDPVPRQGAFEDAQTHPLNEAPGHWCPHSSCTWTGLSLHLCPFQGIRCRSFISWDFLKICLKCPPAYDHPLKVVNLAGGQDIMPHFFCFASTTDPPVFL